MNAADTPTTSIQPTSTPFSGSALTPGTFLERARASHGAKVAVIDGEASFTYDELADRAQRLAWAVRDLSQGRPVALLSPNSHLMVEAHFGVPAAGVPMVPLNIRLSGGELGYIVEHAEAAVLLYDAELADLAAEVHERVPGLVMLRHGGPDDDYEQLLADATEAELPEVGDLDVVSINYTSGTTGQPKGVLCHHRGGYVQALAQVGHAHLDVATVELWTLPMFHCNGWGYVWALTAVGATQVCTRDLDGDAMWSLIREHGVTHLNGAPTVLAALADASNAGGLPSGHVLHVGTGGAPPTPALLARLESLGAHVTHLYGLTETFGPSLICDWRPAWDDLSTEEQARLRARQGVRTLGVEQVGVVDPSGDEVPWDGTTMGEIAVRGQTVMLGYHKDPAATESVTLRGMFLTGDLAVRDPDGYVRILDRSKDTIISGGENIASIEVENVLSDHEAVLEVAVVAVPDERWGEVPAAYVTLRQGQEVEPAELIEHVRANLAHFKAPRYVFFGPLPKTGTGKIQKYVLRERALSDAGGD